MRGFGFSNCFRFGRPGYSGRLYSKTDENLGTKGIANFSVTESFRTEERVHLLCRCSPAPLARIDLSVPAIRCCTLFLARPTYFSVFSYFLYIFQPTITNTEFPAGNFAVASISHWFPYPLHYSLKFWGRFLLCLILMSVCNLLLGKLYGN